MKPLRAVVLAASVVACCTFASRAGAQIAFSAGVDAGISVADPRVQFIDPNVRFRNPRPTIGLGIDFAGYYLPTPSIALGFTMSPAFYGAGPEPSPGINFAVGPRLVWRSGRAHLAADVGLGLSAWNDRCRVELEPGPFSRPDCPPTRRDYEPAAIGYALGLAPLVRVNSGDFVDVLVGPAFRYQSARYEYSDGGGLVLGIYQAVLAVRMFGHFTPLAGR